MRGRGPVPGVHCRRACAGRRNYRPVRCQNDQVEAVAGALARARAPSVPSAGAGGVPKKKKKRTFCVRPPHTFPFLFASASVLLFPPLHKCKPSRPPPEGGPPVPWQPPRLRGARPPRRLPRGGPAAGVFLRFWLGRGSAGGPRPRSTAPHDCRLSSGGGGSERQRAAAARLLSPPPTRRGMRFFEPKKTETLAAGGDPPNPDRHTPPSHTLHQPAPHAAAAPPAAHAANRPRPPPRARRRRRGPALPLPLL